MLSHLRNNKREKEERYAQVVQIRLKKILLLLNEDWKRGRGEVFYKINFFLGKREKKKEKRRKKFKI